MSLRIKIPKRGPATSHHQPIQETGMQRKASKRRISTESDEEDDHGGRQEYKQQRVSDDETMDRRSKRPRVTPDLDIDIDDAVAAEVEADLDVEAVSDDAPEPGPSSAQDTPQHSSRRNSRNVRRPDYRALAGAPSSGRRKSVSSGTNTQTKSKRAAVVYSDDDDEEEYDEEPSHSRGRSREEDEDEDDLEVQSGSRRNGGKMAKNARDSKGKVTKEEEKEVFVRDERKHVPPSTRSPTPSNQGAKRTRTEDEGHSVVEVVSIPPKADPEKGPVSTLPAFKKRKLPTIKKNKMPVVTNGPTGSSISGARPSPGAPAEADKLSSSLLRKTAVSADFDLRDASVYASLFQKPGGTTPNSGLNRKEKEEERRKELNRMRDEARAKRTQEAKTIFNLQAGSEKVSRFEERLHARKSMAIFPNILGATFKDMHERKKRQAMAEAQKERR